VEQKKKFNTIEQNHSQKPFTFHLHLPIHLCSRSRRWIALRSFIKNNRNILWIIGKILVHCCVAAFSVIAGLIWIRDHKPLTYCSGFGQLLVLLVVVYGTILWGIFAPKCAPAALQAKQYIQSKIDVTKKKQKWCGYVFTTIVILVLLALLLYDMRSEHRRLVSFLGAVVLLSLGYIFSRHPGQVSSEST